ncbi:MAG: hypothetical protein KUG82_08775 [Pseudomonadales bacterium]|nr:hypothetical protein [Pseudomonadales bacterium]
MNSLVFCRKLSTIPLGFIELMYESCQLVKPLISSSILIYAQVAKVYALPIPGDFFYVSKHAGDSYAVS